MVFWIIAVCTGLVVAASAISLFEHEGWWVRVFDFPRLQFMVAGGIVLALQLLLLSPGDGWTWVFVGLTVAALFHQIWWIIPYSPLFPKDVKHAKNPNPDNRLRIISVNVLTPNRRAKELLAIIRAEAPDIIIAVETDAWWQEQLDVLEADYPHTVKCPLDNLYGMLVYSRLPLTDTEVQYLVEDQVPSIHGMLTLPSGQKVRLHCIHPAPPSPTENEESTERDAELVIVGKTTAESDYPVIVTGDLNDVAWSATTRLFRKVSGLLDPRIGRGMFNTFNAKYPFLRWPLDHLFHSAEFTLIRLERLPAFGSDHFPILVELALQPKRGEDHETPDADGDDHEWAREKAQNGSVHKSDVHRPGE